MNVGDLLAKAAKKPAKKKSKKNTPEADLPELTKPISTPKAAKLRAEINDLVSSGAMSEELAKSIKLDGENDEGVIGQWKQAHRAKKQAESVMKAAEAKILKLGEKARLEACGDGHFSSSIKLNDKLILSTQNRYSAIPTDHMGRIEELFDEDAEKYFETTTAVALSPAALADENIVAKLIEAVGQENFGRYFEVKQNVKPTVKFHELRSTDPAVREKAETLQDEGILRPAKPSLKIA